MKIILSRKGFDSASGQVPSPIMPDGTLCSLPIPTGSSGGTRMYGEIAAGGTTIGAMVSDLTGGRIGPSDGAHLDPDLCHSSVPRQGGWRPVFGQAGAAEKHLQKEGVGPGDIFLYFGWFREVEKRDGVYRYVKCAPDVHVIFGWLQVESRVPVEERVRIPPWAMEHPHCAREKRDPVADSIYVSRERLLLGGVEVESPGAGLLGEYHERLCLTAAGKLRSEWRLPAWFRREGEMPGLSYHRRPERWARDADSVLLKSTGRGQEFVLDCRSRPEAVGWLGHILGGEALNKSVELP